MLVVPTVRPRVLVAVTPRVYESALVHLLVHAGVDDVFAGSETGVAGRFDVAVLDRVRADVDAEVVVLVPGTADTGEEVIDLREIPGVTMVRGPDQLLAHLDRVAPAERPRADSAVQQSGSP